MQDEFPFASMDFPGCSVLRPEQLGGEQSPIGVSREHIYRLIESGDLQAVDISRREGVASADAIGRSKRQYLRIPIESWHAFLIDRLTVARKPLHQALSTDQLTKHVRECQRELRKRGVSI